MEHVMIIAEIGVNHNGSVELAKKMIDVATQIGVDCVKFQAFNSQKLATAYAHQAEYQQQNMQQETSQLEMLKALELQAEELLLLKQYCDEKQIAFLLAPFDEESIDVIACMGGEWIKIPSGQITDYPYLRKIGQLGKKVILSTGMATIQEIEQALTVVGQQCEEVVLLHCTSEYPAPIEEVNLRAMQTLRERFGCKVGYSDHTQGIEVALGAVALGASIIEKHFTLDKNMKGPDHKASIDPDELNQLVKGVRKIEQALGSATKVPTQSEIKNKIVVRKSIVAKTDIVQGECFSEENITTKRPGQGISPMQWRNVIGSIAKRDFKIDEMIEL